MSYSFAIIGCGRIAQKHAAIAAQRGVVKAVCDLDLQKATDLAKLYGAAAYAEANTLFEKEKVDIACICTPNGLHDEHAILALHKGAHVLCEKPLTLSQERGQAMIRAARSAGKKLFVVKQNRFNPPVQLLKKMVQEGKLGKILSFQINGFWNRPAAYYQDSWRGTLQLDGGTLFTQFSHFIDLLYWILGEVKSVQGQRQNLLHREQIEFEDQGEAILEMASGVMGTLQYSLNSYHHNLEGSFTVFGEKGTVKVGGQYLNRLEHFEVENETAPLLPPGAGSNQYGFYEGSMSNHDQVYDYLLQEIAFPQHHLVEAEEALKSIAIIEAIYKASPLV